jgi:cell wall-associated NlpC family hydrolase
MWNYTVEEIEELRIRIATEAKKLKNVPFAHRGRTRFGLDCLGLVWLAFRRAGIPDIPDGDNKNYEVNWFWFCDKQRYLDGLLQYFFFLENEEPLISDIATFKCYNEELVTHGSIYLGNGNFIHARSGKKVEIANIEHRYWKSKFHKFLRFKGFQPNLVEV